MDDSLCSLDRLRAACRLQARAAHIYSDLVRCMARSLDVQIVLLSICGRRRYCHRGSQESTPFELAAALHIADAFLAADTGPITTQAAAALMNSFAGMRIRDADRTIGTVCLFDRRPGAICLILQQDMFALAQAVVESVHAHGR